MCDSRGSVSIFISIVPCLSLNASLAMPCGVTVMKSTRPSNLPSGTITIVPSCPRMRPGMWVSLAMLELSTSEWPFG